MSDFIKGVQVGNEVKQYDYDSLGNKPNLVQVDATLTEGGKAADAKVVGQRLKEADEHVDSEVSKVNNNSANAVKGYACGTTVSVNDISPIEHTVDVMVHGKNLWVDYISNQEFANGTKVTVNTNGSLTIKKVAGEALNLITTTILMAGTYTLSNGRTKGENIYLCVKFYKDDGTTDFEVNTNNSNAQTFTITEKRRAYIILYSFPAVEHDELIIFPQLEEGDTATEYTPYIDPSNATLTYNGQTYTPNSDGSVDGLVSISPTMEMSASDGFYVHLEYNQDTNAVIKKLTDAIVALGGTV